MSEINHAALREAVSYAMAIHFSQNRQPHMSGDPRARLGPHQMRALMDATDAALAAIAKAVGIEHLHEVANGLVDDYPEHPGPAAVVRLLRALAEAADA